MANTGPSNLRELFFLGVKSQGKSPIHMPGRLYSQLLVIGRKPMDFFLYFLPQVLAVTST